MENKKLKNFFKYKLLFILLIVSLSSVYASTLCSSTVLCTSIVGQWSTGIWSNSSVVSVISWEEVGYWNLGNNSTVIGNYFRGWYYDSVFWFFQLDWSTDSENNVHVIGSTSACSTWYGYKLWGYAYSSYYWFIDFNYSGNIFVYYCVEDGALHGYAYNSHIWFQDFEWIWFEIIPNISSVADNTWTWIFINDTTKINLPNYWDGNINSYIWWDVIQSEDDKESIFYIIK